MKFARWKLNLFMAVLAEGHNPMLAERFYKTALLSAQDICGKESATAGMVLVELEGFLERQERVFEARQAEKAIHGILRRYWFEFKYLS